METRQDKTRLRHVGACDDVSCNVKYGLKIAMLNMDKLAEDCRPPAPVQFLYPDKHLVQV